MYILSYTSVHMDEQLDMLYSEHLSIQGVSVYNTDTGANVFQIRNGHI